MKAMANQTEKRETPWATPRGEIIYAIGDIHGCDDLLAELLGLIHQDIDEHGGQKRISLVFLGDYIDRGPGSKAVIDCLLQQQQAQGASGGPAKRFIHLKGNHEDWLLRFLKNPRVGPEWLVNGGSQTLVSYGVDARAVLHRAQTWAALARAFEAALGAEHLGFFQGLPGHVMIGDYAFVHAGFRPGRPLGKQSEQDMLWIRNRFLDDTRAFEKRVVHGHTPAEAPYVDHRRIGIDTGSFFTGILTAVRLEDHQVRFLQTGEA